MDDSAFDKLLEYLKRVPAIEGQIGSGSNEEGFWWIKFTINTSHPLAWNTVQEFGYVLNNLSINEPLPSVFFPVSPPPYLNGGPDDFLSWVIENRHPDFLPDEAQEWLEGRLPNPVDRLSEWGIDGEDREGLADEAIG